MFQTLLAAKDYGDWIQVVFVVVVVLASALGKLAQSIIARLNERQQERRSGGTRPEAIRPKSVASDRPVARPMPSSASERPAAAPFGEGARRDRGTTRLPPVARVPEGLENALGEVLARLGVPDETASRRSKPATPSSGPQQRTPVDPRSRRTGVGRSTRAPMAGAQSQGRPKRTSPPSPPPTAPGTKQRGSSKTAVQRAPADAAPIEAEQRFGHLRREVEAKEHAPEHLTFLHSSLVQDTGQAGPRRTGSLRTALGLNDRLSVRRAMVLAEVLGPPLSMRDVV